MSEFERLKTSCHEMTPTKEQKIRTAATITLLL